MSQEVKPVYKFNVMTHFAIMDKKGLNSTARLIMLHIARRGRCYQSAENIGKNLEIGKATVIRHRKSLLEMGAIILHSEGFLCINGAFLNDADRQADYQNDNETIQNDNQASYQNESSGYQNGSPSYQNDPRGYQNDNTKETSKEAIKETREEEAPPPIGSDMNGTLVPKSYGNHYQDFEDGHRELTRNGGEILGYLFDICHHIPRTKEATARNLSHYLDSQGIDSATVKNALSSPTGYWCAHDWRGKKGDKPHLSQAETAVMEHIAMQDKIKLAKEKTATMGAMFYG